MIYRLIMLRDTRDVNRDVFAAQISGFDQHFNMKQGLSTLLGNLNSAISGFRTALTKEELWNSVTIVMTSEFGRTVTPNASGGEFHQESYR